MTADREAMEAALEEARQAAEAGEVPIGAVAVYDGEMIAVGQNRVLRDKRSDRARGDGGAAGSVGGAGQLSPERSDAVRDIGAVRDVRGGDDPRAD